MLLNGSDDAEGWLLVLLLEEVALEVDVLLAGEVRVACGRDPSRSLCTVRQAGEKQQQMLASIYTPLGVALLTIAVLTAVSYID